MVFCCCVDGIAWYSKLHIFIYISLRLYKRQTIKIFLYIIMSKGIPKTDAKGKIANILHSCYLLASFLLNLSHTSAVKAYIRPPTRDVWKGGNYVSQ